MTIVVSILLLISLFIVGGMLGSIGGYIGVFQSEDNLENMIYKREIITSYILMIIFPPSGIMGALYLITRDNKRAKYDGKIILLISLVLLTVYILDHFIIYFKIKTSGTWKQLKNHNEHFHA